MSATRTPDWASVRPARVEALRSLGFTERQARFLTHVLVFSGVFLERQYCQSAGIVHGQKSHDFIERLIARGYVTPITPGSVQRGRMYHVQHKPLYEAIGEPDNRHRKPTTVGCLIRRLMLLDAVLSNVRYHWLGTERDKVGYFATYLTRDVSREYPLHWYPHIAFGEGRHRTFRLFPDKLPIGVEKDGYRRHVFLYLATRPYPWDFRLFLLRHASLLQSVSDWRLRVLLPRRLRKAKALYQAALIDQLLRPLEPCTVERLEAFFKQCRETHGHVSEPADEHLAKAFRQFGTTRFRALYRVWPRLGDVLTFGWLIKDKYERGDAGIEYQELRRQYLQLTGLIGHDGRPRRGDKRRTRAVGPSSANASSADPPSPLATP